MYRLTFDGSVADEHGFVAMGGSAEAISAVPRGRATRDGARRSAPRIRLAVARARAHDSDEAARRSAATQLEVAGARTAAAAAPRKFRRLSRAPRSTALLAG